MPSTTFQWLSLVAVIWLQAINGTNTNFPAYSSELKHVFSLSQIQLNSLAFASDAGKLFGWISGVAAIYLPLWLVLMIGSALGLIGYGVQYLFITSQIASPSYWHIFLLSVVSGNSICWINTVCYVVTIQNFGLSSQVAVGLSTSYSGLSAKIYTQIVDTFFSSSSSSSSPLQQRAKSYLLLNSFLPLAICIIASPLVTTKHTGDGASRPGGRSGFIAMFIITIATGIYAVISCLGRLSDIVSPYTQMISLGVLLLAPLLVPIGEITKAIKSNEEWCGYATGGEKRVYDDATEDADDMNKIENGMKAEERFDGEVGGEIRVMEEVGVKTMLRRIEFWLYFAVYITGATLGFVFLNNLGQIAESRGYSNTSSLVSLSSSFGFFGRLLPSLLDYFFSRSKYMISRPASIAALMAPMTGAFFILLNSTTFSLYVSTAVIGVCTGAIVSLSVATTTELFGTKNFSVNHNVVVANIPIGSFIFGSLAALVYNKQGDKSGTCVGMGCYNKSFTILGSLCLFGTLLSLILHARTRKFYNKTC